jgi:hypothetical protein
MSKSMTRKVEVNPGEYHGVSGIHDEINNINLQIKKDLLAKK